MHDMILQTVQFGSEDGMSWIPSKHGTDLMYLDLFVSLAWVYQQDSDRWFICGRPEGI